MSEVRIFYSIFFYMDKQNVLHIWFIRLSQEVSVVFWRISADLSFKEVNYYNWSQIGSMKTMPKALQIQALPVISFQICVLGRALSGIPNKDLFISRGREKFGKHMIKFWLKFSIRFLVFLFLPTTLLFKLKIDSQSAKKC